MRALLSLGLLCLTACPPAPLRPEPEPPRPPDDTVVVVEPEPEPPALQDASSGDAYDLACARLAELCGSAPPRCAEALRRYCDAGPAYCRDPHCILSATSCEQASCRGPR